MPDEQILRGKAREVIESGKLPSGRPDRTWGGPGVGAPCAVCGLPVKRDELEFEIRVSIREEGAGVTGEDLLSVLWRSRTTCGAASPRLASDARPQATDLESRSPDNALALPLHRGRIDCGD